MKRILFSTLALALCAAGARAQTGESGLRTFGYFQTTFQYQESPEYGPENTSFLVQQLNLFLQRDLARDLTSLVDFEVTSSYSSSRRWGAFNLEEAWVRYRANRTFSLKVGLSIPVFNNLNEIKTKTPLLPYIVRPLVYEASLAEIIALDEYVPNRAYVQAWGFLPLDPVKVDYALYLGNSPNVNSDPGVGQTGVDTTRTFLVGGRTGIRTDNLKAGLSATYDRADFLAGAELLFGGAPSGFLGIRRLRLGADLSYHLGRFAAEGEFIRVAYDEDVPDLLMDKRFYYATLGYELTDNAYAYVSYWLARQEQTAAVDKDFRIFDGEDLEQALREGTELIPIAGELDIQVPTFGASYGLNERVTLKAQYAFVTVRLEDEIGRSGIIIPEERFHNVSVALSVFF